MRETECGTRRWRARLAGAVLALATAAPIAASAGDPPKVAASIAPVQSLAAMAMRGIGAPTLLTPLGASPHHYAMRPGDAASLAEADLVFWIGPELERWMDRPLKTLGSGARITALGAVEGVRRLPSRRRAVWGGSEHADHKDHAGHAEHEDHAGHAEHEDHAAHEERDHAHEGGVDPHFWLDPENAMVWLDRIAADLAAADPERAALYRANAEAGRAELTALTAEIAAKTAPLKDRGFIVFHDAFAYFEERFGVRSVGAISLSDATPPSAQRVAEIERRIAESGAVCIFTEPQFAPKLAQRLAEGSGARIGTLDPVGSDLEPGPAFYPALLRGLAEGMAECLSEGDAG